MNHEYGDPQDAGQLEAKYANYFEVGHNAFEFLLDFGQFYPENERPHRHTRIITGPALAKVLFVTLQESIERYEQTFGSISRPEY
jgi:hypothetical protein